MIEGSIKHGEVVIVHAGARCGDGGGIGADISLPALAFSYGNESVPDADGDYRLTEKATGKSFWAHARFIDRLPTPPAPRARFNSGRFSIEVRQNLEGSPERGVWIETSFDNGRLSRGAVLSVDDVDDFVAAVKAAAGKDA